jgi:thymidine phosphorylase
MEQPLGRNVGNALEVAEAVEVLHGGGPEDVRELTLKLAGEMLALAGPSASPEEGEKSAKMVVIAGKAYAKFQEIVEAQGGDPRYVIDPSQLPKSPRVHAIESPREGYVTALDAFEVGEIVVHLGGGRLKKDDKVDPAVGVVLLKKVGDRVQAGEPLATIHARDAAQEAIHSLQKAYRIGDEQPLRTPLLLERLQAPPAAV